jgi:uncharacterized membrane protein YeaQ/YmgE (transglycosylase-associated protein family)
MGILITLILGGLAGWIASIIVNRNDRMGLFANIVAGLIGAFFANWLLAPLFDTAARLDTFTVSGFIMSVLGAVVVLVLWNLITLRRVRA